MIWFIDLIYVVIGYRIRCCGCCWKCFERFKNYIDYSSICIYSVFEVIILFFWLCRVSWRLIYVGVLCLCIVIVWILGVYDVYVVVCDFLGYMIIILY